MMESWWDYYNSHASSELIEQQLLSFKRGKFLEKLCGKLKEKGEVSIKRAVTFKYHSFLSRRKCNFLCKIQQNTYDPQDEKYRKIMMSYADYKLEMQVKWLSHTSLQRFINSLDIGNLHQIDGHSGVTITVTALITMIVDLNLKIPSLKRNMIWFNGNANYFIVKVSDNDAPKSGEQTMAIGTLSLNFGNRICSREGNAIVTNGVTCTFQFYSAVDTAWLCLGCNEISCSATYPSLFGQVHKHDLSQMNGSICDIDKCSWKISSLKSQEDLKLLKTFQKQLMKRKDKKLNIN